ncbi:hypothetical protein BJP40_06710 [Streptomyces sp. CC53]|uniref:hypothetical protein n=1 Tax=Streptomyces sp. CC53 TaxID=1906740 RepID=UPI0008DE3604|nr:hypothetical protein [Streptomyces sp. CC53]OII61212.1 hypothetical protein BJP40_06710 [Streptomyces sp. CC53]
MAGKQILTNCKIVVDGVDFTNHASSVEITASKDEVDTTSFDGAGRERKAGLQDNSFTINFQQDFDANEVDATLFPLWNNATEFTVAVRPVDAAISATNPEYSGTCILLEYTPLAGSVGDLSETEVTFPVQRGTFTRATS